MPRDPFPFRAPSAHTIRAPSAHTIRAPSAHTIRAPSARAILAPSARLVRARTRHAPCWGSDSSRLLHGPAVRVRRLENSPSRGCLVRARAVAHWRESGGVGVESGAKEACLACRGSGVGYLAAREFARVRRLRVAQSGVSPSANRSPSVHLQLPTCGCVACSTRWRRARRGAVRGG